MVTTFSKRGRTPMDADPSGASAGATRRTRRVAAALVAAASLAMTGGLMLSAAASPIRLVGVSVQGSTVLIEATDPAPYAVVQPDPLTVLVDLRTVTAATNVAAQVTGSATVADVKVEQKTTPDGGAMARVRVLLARPADYKVRSTRNTIRLDLAPAASRGPRFDVSAPPAPML